MNQITEESDKKEIILKITKQKSGMKYKDKTYEYHRINAIPKELLEHTKGYFEINDNKMKLTVFENDNIVFSLERRRKQASILSEENFNQRQEIKDWKERFENVQKHSLKLTAKAAEFNYFLKEKGINYRIDPLDGKIIDRA